MNEINYRRERVTDPTGKDIMYIYTHIGGDEGKPFYNLFVRLYTDSSCTDEHLVTSTRIYSVDWSGDLATPHKKIRVWNPFKKPIPESNGILIRFGVREGGRTFYVKVTSSKLPDPNSGTITTLGCVEVG